MKVFSKKEWRKHKDKESKREKENFDAGVVKGKMMGRNEIRDILAAVVYNQVCREPGQVSGNFQIERSLIGQVSCSFDHYGPTMTINVQLKAYEPQD